MSKQHLMHTPVLQRLEGIESGCNAVSFERLSAFRDAFDDVIKLNQKFGPVLNRIKVSREEREREGRRNFYSGLPLVLIRGVATFQGLTRSVVQ